MTDSRIAAALAAASVALLVFACGRTVDAEATDGGADGATGAPTESGMPAPGFDGSLNPFTDGSIAPIDAGSPPIVPCTDAGMTCASPPSDCLDEHTMRYFGGGTCNDAGTCDFMIFTMKCDPSPVPPDCYQGGCRIVIVR
jgi:hypothetical protein